MKIIQRDCPIAVISTNSQASAALGVIRFSGFKDINVFKDVLTVKTWKPRNAHFLKVLDDSSEVLDEGIGIYFNAPNSFTGENILELQLHGNPLSLNKILKFLCQKLGFSLALPGEFTYRAFRNKKLNLSQVEGLDLLLNANSGFGLSAANKMLSNELFNSYLKLRQQYLELRSAIEISIDFSEDVGDEVVSKKIDECMSLLKKEIDLLYRRSQGRLSDLLTPAITLIGKTNAGKSTFFNKLLDSNRAIVSDVHGTTRDFVSEYWSVGDHPFRLIDTAGLRESSDSIEIEGIGRTISLMKDSFFKILVINPYQNADNLKESYIDSVDAIVLTHLDLGNTAEVKLPKNILTDKQIFGSFGPMGAGTDGPMGAEFNGSIGAANFFGPIGPIFSSAGPMGARENGSIGPERSLEASIIDKYQALTRDNPIPIQRHRDLIYSIYNKYGLLESLLGHESDVAIISSEVNGLGVDMDELLGIVNSEEVLDHIFANFCIGK